MSVAEGQLFLDDFAPGQSFEGATRRLGDDAFAAFAALTGDAHPIHYDDDYARRTIFGGRLAHGLLLAAMTALGATPLSRRVEASMVALLEQGGRFLKPVLVGDTVTSGFTVAAIEPNDRIRFAVTLTNQRGETVYDGFHLYKLKRR
jgi:3-hydroxybutyryl-CoA dehydratase